MNKDLIPNSFFSLKLMPTSSILKADWESGELSLINPEGDIITSSGAVNWRRRNYYIRFILDPLDEEADTEMQNIGSIGILENISDLSRVTTEANFRYSNQRLERKDSRAVYFMLAFHAWPLNNSTYVEDSSEFEFVGFITGRFFSISREPISLVGG